MVMVRLAVCVGGSTTSEEAVKVHDGETVGADAVPSIQSLLFKMEGDGRWYGIGVGGRDVAVGAKGNGVGTRGCCKGGQVSKMSGSGQSEAEGSDGRVSETAMGM